MNSIPVRPLSDLLYEDAQMIEVQPNGIYPITGIYSFGRGLIKRPPIQGSETSYQRMARLRVGQIVMSKLNAWEGALTVVDQPFNDTYVSPEYPVFSINSEIACAAYLENLLRWPNLWNRLTPRGSMVRRKRTTPSTFLATEVPLPELDEQRRIADKLNTAMSRIAQFFTLRSYSSQLSEQYMDSLFRPIGDQLPLSVALCPNSDFVGVEPDDKYRTAGILNRGRGLFHRPIISGSDTKYRRYNRLHTGQFVYSKLFGWEGSLAVVPADFEGIHVSHEFPTFDIDSAVADVEYMTHLARWSGLHEALKDKGTGMGSRRQRVNVDRLLATTVPLPSLPEQRRIARQLAMVRRATETGAEQTTQVAGLRLALLNAAFSGQL